MTIRFDKLIKNTGIALDIIEKELLGAATHHGKRVAVLVDAMGRFFGLDDGTRKNLSICALFHDNALSEYILSERAGLAPHDPSMKLHCELGQKNLEALLPGNISGYVLYHHEWANGQGPFGKREGECPLAAELICLADATDVRHRYNCIDPDKLPQLIDRIKNDRGIHFTNRAVEAACTVINEELLHSLSDDCIREALDRAIPPEEVDIQNTMIIKFALLVSRIIDYKSAFTRRHTAQIANKAWYMGNWYKWNDDRKAQFFLAASLHDLGKLAIPTEILEKPGALTPGEFLIIKDHVRITWELLKDIEGMETICDWASNHHEKLDGSGYHAGKGADKLDFNSRLLACIDIYQAVSEERPYHPGRTHRDTMGILFDMAGRGFIDGGIVNDLNMALQPFNGGDVPLPKILDLFNTPVGY
ncbi:MAG: HD domain-containing protein [Spirochaetaceae bacterium]|jgi:HD-GYP domain-containing protein (c-di-GMP phosphodiesterase class II)|nr:HD domain-containing protein [Spirochaetaceae bacterium]